MLYLTPQAVCRITTRIATERCWSGRTGLPAKQLSWQNRDRGFESPPLRHKQIHQIQQGLREIALSVVTSNLGISRRILKTFDPKILRILSPAHSANKLNPEISSFR